MSSTPAPGPAPLTSVNRAEARSLQTQVARLLNRQLSSICQVNGLKSTGNKADLIKRVHQLILEVAAANDPLRFSQIRQSITNAIHNIPAATPSTARAQQLFLPPITSSHSLPLPRGDVTSHHMPGSLPPPSSAFDRDALAAFTNGRGAAALPYSQTLNIIFKTSPFYHVEGPIGDVRICDVMSQHRHTISIPLRLNDHPALQDCVTNKSYRVMVFCADDTIGLRDVAFPHQSEIRVNGGDIKSNLRGLKGKPGSTRPVDITSALRLRPNYSNTLEFTYALTSKTRKKYYLVVNLCKVATVDELTNRIKNGKKIPKDSVLRELNKKAQDPDVVATSQVLSLKCPLTYMRLSLPCRGSSCAHIQCFDATSYLQLQQQGPTWMCPICNKHAAFEALAVDEYVKDILEKTPKSLEAVTIEPNGHWLVKNAEEERQSQSQSQSQTNGTKWDGVGDDDFEISEVSVVSGRHFETPRNPTSNSSTPVSVGRDGASAGRGLGAKRPAAAVIDLTLSSDEDDEPITRRPTKRRMMSSSGFSAQNEVGDLLNDGALEFSS